MSTVELIRNPAAPAAAGGLACSSCALRDLCLPSGLTAQETARLDGLVARKLHLRRGERLYRTGQPFEALYAIRTGFFKTRTSTCDGREHVTGFQMAGELLGLDGIGSDEHTCDAIALEDSRVCVIPFGRLERLCGEMPGLGRQLHRIMGREIVRDHAAMLLLGSMRAEERVAAFLVNLSRRLKARGFSSTSLILRMTRQEIGTCLGLKLETVSRCFSKFQDDGLLNVRSKRVELVDPAALEALVAGASA